MTQYKEFHLGSKEYQLLAFHLKCKDKWNTIPSLNIFKYNKYKYIGIMVCGGSMQLCYLGGSRNGRWLSKNLSDKGQIIEFQRKQLQHIPHLDKHAWNMRCLFLAMCVSCLWLGNCRFEKEVSRFRKWNGIGHLSCNIMILVMWSI